MDGWAHLIGKLLQFPVRARALNVWCPNREPAVSHLVGRCYTGGVPTTRPRYTFTDTGDLEALLDAAQRRWPEISDRKALLLRLAEEGGSALGFEAERIDVEERRERMQAALKRLRSLVDVELLLSDSAWR